MRSRPPRKPPALNRRRLAFVVIGSFALALVGSGCAGPAAARTDAQAAHRPVELRADLSIRNLRDALVALHPTVSPLEAGRLSDRAHTVSRQLAREYRAVGSPHFQNFLVNTGFRKRGLCFQWTEDLTRRLQALHLTTLELHWAEAHAGTLREHNCVVVTARGQPFAEGIILDAWRHSGRLFWSSIRADDYPWKKDATNYMRRISSRSSRTGR